MSKYHFVFEDQLGDKIIEYDSEVEPPRIGEIVQFNALTDDRNQNTYRIRDVVHESQNASEARVVFQVEKIN